MSNYYIVRNISLMSVLLTFLNITCHSQIDSNSVIIYDVPPFEIENWYIELNDSVKDIDGNYYELIQLGDQIWFKNNLQVSKYNNGQAIPLIQEDSIWALTDNDAYTINKVYSSNNAYYNYHVVTNELNVCPAGFRIPDSSDWAKVEEYAEQVNNDFNLGLFYVPKGDTIHLREKHMDCWQIFEANNWQAWHLSFSNDAKGFKSGRSGKYKLGGNFGYWWIKDSESIASSYTRIFIDRCRGIDDIHIEDFFYSNGGFSQNHGLPIRCIQE